jgi:branched-chain amino acid transport system permease protein
MTYYLTTLLVYAGVDILACLAISLQFGVSGIVNFSFIIFQAAGAYTAAVLSLPPDSANGGFQTYVLGLQLPFPLPWIGATLVGALLAFPVGLVVLRRLRSDYQAIAMLVLSVIATLVITNTPRFLDGAAGVSLVPQPLSDRFDPYSNTYLWTYVAGTLLVALLVFFVVQRIINSPYGRSLRAMREHELAATALGKNSVALKMTVFVVGGAIAGLSGAILIGFITTWAPSTWLYPETLILFAAVIVGGRGNNYGAVLGALLVPVGFEEATRYLPSFGPPGLVPAIEWVCIGGLILGFLWFRPRGVFPERRRLFPPRAEAAALEDAGAG